MGAAFLAAGFLAAASFLAAGFLAAFFAGFLAFLAAGFFAAFFFTTFLALSFLALGAFFGFLNLANLELASTLTGILSLDNGSSSKGLSESKLQGSSSLGSINLVVGNNVLEDCLAR